MSPLVAPSTLSVAMLARRASRYEETPPPMPIPAIASAARPTSTRNSPIRADEPLGPRRGAVARAEFEAGVGEARLEAASTAASGSAPAGRRTRVLLRNIAPGAVSPAAARQGLAATIATGAEREAFAQPVGLVGDDPAQRSAVRRRA